MLLFALVLTATLSVGCEQVKGLIESNDEAPPAAPVDPAAAVNSPSGEAPAGQPTDPADAVAAPSEAQPADELSAPAQKFYTTYNLWYEKVDTLQAINYKTGVIIPAGTEVTGISTSARRFRSDVINFTTPSNGVTFSVAFNQKYHPGKTIEDYRNMMFTNKTFEELTEGLSPLEIEAIQAGSLKVGMSRRAVIIAYGYPPEHATPDLNSNVWKYWMNRFQTKSIYFDDTGRTRTPPPGASDGL